MKVAASRLLKIVTTNFVVRASLGLNRFLGVHDKVIEETNAFQA
jgi:hypothetical protein